MGNNKLSIELVKTISLDSKMLSYDFSRMGIPIGPKLVIMYLPDELDNDTIHVVNVNSGNIYKIVVP